MSTMAKVPPALSLDSGACSHVGQVRENNEDAFRLAPELALFVLSDGMGGLEAGEIASHLTVDTIFAHCRDAEADPSLAYEDGQLEGASDASNRLASAIQIANRIVRAAARTADGDPADSGGAGVPRGAAAKAMGATVVAIRFFGDRVSIAHVGDSRAYRLRTGELSQLTDDHSLVAQQVRDGRMTESEAEASPLKNVLTRALGVGDELDVEVDEELVLEGDIYLLCSDGLTRELSDRQIAALLGEASDAQQAAGRLVEMANQAGGGDNITALVVRVAKPAGAMGRIGRWIRGSGN